MLTLWLLCGLGCAPEPATPSDPTSGETGTTPPPTEVQVGGNVLVVLIDDVGIDKLASYGLGASPPPTPTLDGIAARGVRFENAWALPECSPTRAALLTGRLPRRTGVGQIIGAHEDFRLADDEITIAELLRPAGYATALVGKWHLGPTRVEEADAPMRQGFDRFLGVLGNLQTSTIPGAAQVVPLGYWRWEADRDGVLSWRDDYAGSVPFDDALAVVSELPEPWFLYLPAIAAHSPWDAPPEALLDGPPAAPQDPAGRYDQVLTVFDRELGRLLDTMDPAVRARTTVIVMGDNGTPHEVVRPPIDPLRSKGTPFEGAVRVPLLIEGPGIPAGRVSDAMAHVVDLLPTVAELAGVSLDDGVARDGNSLLPALRAPEDPGPREFLYSEKFRPNGAGPWTELDVRMLRDRDHRLVWSPDREWFFRFRGPLDEGPDLLEAPLSAEDQAAYDRLRAALDDQEGVLGLR